MLALTFVRSPIERPTVGVGLHSLNAEWAVLYPWRAKDVPDEILTKLQLTIPIGYLRRQRSDAGELAPVVS